MTDVNVNTARAGRMRSTVGRIRVCRSCGSPIYWANSAKTHDCLRSVSVPEVQLFDHGPVAGIAWIGPHRPPDRHELVHIVAVRVETHLPHDGLEPMLPINRIRADRFSQLASAGSALGDRAQRLEDDLGAGVRGRRIS